MTEQAKHIRRYAADRLIEAINDVVEERQPVELALNWFDRIVGLFRSAVVRELPGMLLVDEHAMTQSDFRAMVRAEIRTALLEREGAVAAQLPASSAANEASKLNLATPGERPTITIELGASLADIEKQVVLATLEYCEDRKERTAAVLGVSLKTLYNRLTEYREQSAAQSA